MYFFFFSFEILMVIFYFSADAFYHPHAILSAFADGSLCPNELFQTRLPTDFGKLLDGLGIVEGCGPSNRDWNPSEGKSLPWSYAEV